jgi:hypothetical protein
MPERAPQRPDVTIATAPALSYSSAPGRWVLAVTVLGSGIAALDATVVNIALPTIGREFHTGVSALQLQQPGSQPPLQPDDCFRERAACHPPTGATARSRED